MAGLLGVLVILATVYALMLGGRGHSFRPGVARTSVRRARGGNLASMLAVVAIAGLLIKVGESPLGQIPGVAPVLAGLVVALVIGVAVSRGLTSTIVTLAGFALLATSVGVSGAISLLILVALMLWILGLARGFLA
jgi:hypothetical protein